MKVAIIKYCNDCPNRLYTNDSLYCGIIKTKLKDIGLFVKCPEWCPLDTPEDSIVKRWDEIRRGMNR